MTRTIVCILLCAVFSLHAAIIKVGSVLDIQVLSHPEFSGRYTVSSSGTIEYPLFADETIINISTSELMNDLTIRLAKHVENPLVLISVVEKPKITVTVLGEVLKPGPVETFAGASIQEVIQLAGGPVKNANLEKVKIVHSAGGDNNAEFFDLKNFSQRGDIDEMPKLQADDIVILLTGASSKKVKVIGAVNKPGIFELEEKMNLFELIYLAGGPAEKADLSRVRRFSRNSDGKPIEEVLNIQSFIDKGKMDNIPIAIEGDVIIVYSKWFDWKMLLTVLTNVLLFIVTIQSIRGAVAK